MAAAPRSAPSPARNVASPPDARSSLGDASALLAEGIEKIGLHVQASDRERLLDYLKLMLQWNRVYNLTAIRDLNQCVTTHLLDSLAIMPPLLRAWSDTDATLQRAGPLIVDIGTGAGLPGIPLAIAWPESQIRMIEPIGKKVAFVRHAIGRLKLSRAAILHRRAEQCCLQDLKPVADSSIVSTSSERNDLEASTRAPDFIISRAFASLADFARASHHLTGPGTRLAAMKSGHIDDELDELPEPWRRLESIPIDVPGLGAKRTLILLQLQP